MYVNTLLKDNMTLANVETKIETCEGRGLHLVKKLATTLFSIKRVWPIFVRFTKNFSVRFKERRQRAKKCPCNLN